MRQLIIIFFILLTQIGLAIDVSVLPSSKQVNLGAVGLDDGFYGGPEGNINLTIANKTVGTPADLSVQISQPLMSNEGQTIAASALMWKIYWASISAIPWDGVDTSSSAGFNSWVSYRVLTDDTVLRVNPATNALVNVTLGTQLTRIPAVQPSGIYRTQIMFTVTQ
jgi:hypothetical protein